MTEIATNATRTDTLSPLTPLRYPQSSGIDLADQRLPELPTPSGQPFRRPALSEASIMLRAERLSQIASSRQVEQLRPASLFCAPQAFYQFEVPVPALPLELDGLRVLVASDPHLHSGRLMGHRLDSLHLLADRIKSESQGIDLLLIGGDFITHDPADLSLPALEALRRIKGTADRAYFVLGNHDYYSWGCPENGNPLRGSRTGLLGREEKQRRRDSSEIVRAKLRSVGLIDLDISSSPEEIVIRGARVRLYGVEDALEGDPRPPSLSYGYEQGLNIVVAHCLDALDAEWPADLADLVISGHWHAGEVSIGRWNGIDLKHWFGYGEGLNQQLCGWDAPTDRAVSYVSPGMARHYAHFGVDSPGAALCTLRCMSGLLG